MIFIDESGDDGNTNKSSQKFFVVSAYFDDVKLYTEENQKLRRLLNYKKIEMKWNKLDHKQKEFFDKYTKSVNYKIDYFVLDKQKSNFKYKDILMELLGRNNINKNLILYKGEHMTRMMAEVLHKLKKYKVRASHREIIDQECLGIEIADLWAGYIRQKNESDLQ